MPKQEYQYGQGYDKDLKSLLKLVKKESENIDPYTLVKEIKKIIKFNKFQSLPRDCPKCGKRDVDWEWEVGRYLVGDSYINEATCPECETVFHETMETVSWEYRDEEEKK